MRIHFSFTEDISQTSYILTEYTDIHIIYIHIHLFIYLYILMYKLFRLSNYNMTYVINIIAYV